MPKPKKIYPIKKPKGKKKKQVPLPSTTRRIARFAWGGGARITTTTARRHGMVMVHADAQHPRFPTSGRLSERKKRTAQEAEKETA